MKVFVTGGTGFVGRATIKQLLTDGHEVRVLVREGSESKLPEAQQVDLFYGDVTEVATLSGALADCDAVIHLVGIIREFPDRGITFNKVHVE